MCCVRGVGVQGLTMTHSQQNSCLHTFISPHHLILFLSLTPQGIALAKICPMVPSTPRPAPVRIPDKPLFYPSCIPLRDLQDLFRALRRSPSTPSHHSPALGALLAMRECFRSTARRLHAGPLRCGLDDVCCRQRIFEPVTVLCGGIQGFYRLSQHFT